MEWVLKLEAKSGEGKVDTIEFLPIIVCIVDNGMYGTIRMHQERHYPGRVSATDLQNPDFAAYARAFGGHGERVERTEDFAGAFDRAIASGRAAILHLIISAEAITPAVSLAELRASGMRAQLAARTAWKRSAGGQRALYRPC